MRGRQLPFPEPVARLADPDTSHEAARAVRPSAERLRKEIRKWFAHNGPASQAQCADALSLQGWDWRTVVTACNTKRSGLVRVATARHVDEDDHYVGAPFGLYSVPLESTPDL